MLAMRVHVAPCLFLLLSGCARTPPPVRPPSTAARQLATALQQDDAQAAYHLLSPAVRREVSLSQFRRQWEENAAERRRLGEALQQAAPPRAHAAVVLENGERIPLVLEDGYWRLQGDVMNVAAMETPADTVAALRRALQRRSMDGLLRLLSRGQRAAWEARFEEIIQETQDPLGLEIEIDGQKAVVHTGDGDVIRLRKEAGEWRVTAIE